MLFQDSSLLLLKSELSNMGYHANLRNPNCMKQHFDYFISFTTFLVMGLKLLSCFLIYYYVLAPSRCSLAVSLVWEEIVHFHWQALMVFVTINSSHWYENKGKDFFLPAVFVIFLYDVCVIFNYFVGGGGLRHTHRAG